MAIVDTGGKKFVGETDDVKGAHCYEVSAMELIEWAKLGKVEYWWWAGKLLLGALGAGDNLILSSLHGHK